MELKFLGIGSAFNTELGNTSAFIKQTNKFLLIDCGETVFSTLKNNGLLDDIKEFYIIISHLHGDHVGSLSSLIYYLNYIKKIKPKIIINNNDFCKNLSEFLLFSGVDSMLYEYVKPKFNNIKIIPILTKHSSKMQSFSYIFEENNELTFFSADTKDVEFLTEFINKNECKIYAVYHDTCYLDYVGNNHTSLSNMEKVVPEHFRHKVYCMHLDDNNLIDLAKERGFNIPNLFNH